VEGSRPTDEFRAEFSFERKQRVERVGRTCAGVAYVSTEEPEAVMSYLATGEADHLAALLGTFGYRTPVHVREQVAPEVLEISRPGDLLASGACFRLWQLGLDTRQSAADSGVSSVGVSSAASSDESTGSRSSRSASVESETSCSDFGRSQSAASTYSARDWFMVDLEVPEAQLLDRRTYYHWLNVNPATMRSELFPRGIDSVRKFLERQNCLRLLSSLTDEDVEAFANSLLHLYNGKVAEIRAMERLIARIGPSPRIRDVRVRDLVGAMYDQYAVIEGVIAYRARCVEALAVRGPACTAMDPEPDVESVYDSKITQRFLPVVQYVFAPDMAKQTALDYLALNSTRGPSIARNRIGYGPNGYKPNWSDGGTGRLGYGESTPDFVEEKDAVQLRPDHKHTTACRLHSSKYMQLRARTWRKRGAKDNRPDEQRECICGGEYSEYRRPP